MIKPQFHAVAGHRDHVMTPPPLQSEAWVSPPPLLINRGWAAAGSAQMFDTINPATDEGGQPRHGSVKALETFRRGSSDAAAWVELVTRVIDRILASGPLSTAHDWNSNSRNVLAILTCHYAAGVYASQEIETLIRDVYLEDEDWEGPIPDWNVLRCFRRRYRPLIHRCLSEVLEVSHGADQPRVENGFGRFEGHPWAEPRAGLLGVWPTQWAEEAEKRIQRAVVLDSAALDD